MPTHVCENYKVYWLMSLIIFATTTGWTSFLPAIFLFTGSKVPRNLLFRYSWEDLLPRSERVSCEADRAAHGEKLWPGDVQPSRHQRLHRPKWYELSNIEFVKLKIFTLSAITIEDFCCCCNFFSFFKTLLWESDTLSMRPNLLLIQAFAKPYPGRVCSVFKYTSWCNVEIQ